MIAEARTLEDLTQARKKLRDQTVDNAAAELDSDLAHFGGLGNSFKDATARLEALINKLDT